MITVRLKGGQGNQMFQYAFARAVALRNGDELQLDLTFLLDRTPGLTSIFGFVVRDYDINVFNLKEERFTSLSRAARGFPIPLLWAGLSAIITKIKSWTGKQVFVSESHAAIPRSGDIYLSGYWQSEDYFASIASEIRREFTLRDPLPPAAEQLAREIGNGESVCVNVRRGDFVSLERSAKRHGFIGTEYYSEGMKLVRERTSDKLHAYVFSDEIEWCRENIKFPGIPTTYVGYEYKGAKFEAYLHLMSLSKYFLIPNSTFGWWAAWLSDRPGKLVIAPKQWYADANARKDDPVPSSWARI